MKKWHIVALRLALGLVPHLVEALLDGRVSSEERAVLVGRLAEALAEVASRP